MVQTAFAFFGPDRTKPPYSCACCRSAELAYYTKCAGYCLGRCHSERADGGYFEIEPEEQDRLIEEAQAKLGRPWFGKTVNGSVVM